MQPSLPPVNTPGNTADHLTVVRTAAVPVLHPAVQHGMGDDDSVVMDLLDTSAAAHMNGASEVGSIGNASREGVLEFPSAAAGSDTWSPLAERYPPSYVVKCIAVLD